MNRHGWVSFRWITTLTLVVLATIVALRGADVVVHAEGRMAKPLPTSSPSPSPSPSPNPATTASQKEPPVIDESAVRAPAVAGSFYPGDAQGLDASVQKFLSPIPKKTFPKPIRALIVPHAGYIFSAGCAAHAFKQLDGSDIDRVVLLGCPHQIPISGLAVWAKGAWDTPLGRVNVDEVAARTLLAESPRIRENRQAHQPEHSLEVMVPFLQKVLKPGFTIVPVLIHDASDADQKAFEAGLVKILDRQSLLVVSTDLTHYPSRKDAEEVDRKTLDSWKTLDAATVESVSREQMKRGLRELLCTQCGEQAVVALMKAAKTLGIKGIEILSSTNSAAASGDSGRVVGYGAAALYGDAPSGLLARPPLPPPAPEVATSEVSAAGGKRLLAIVREAITCATSGKPLPSLQNESGELDLKRGCFVTLHLAGQLRGCIGCFDSSDPLPQTVQKFAVAAAMQDPRFSPVSESEVPKLDLEISILSKVVPCDDHRKIVLGKHGVIIRKDGRSGVFLPQVATETGWNLEEFLGHLARDKAGIGYQGWKESNARLFTFTVQIIK